MLSAEYRTSKTGKIMDDDAVANDEHREIEV